LELKSKDFIVKLNLYEIEPHAVGTNGFDIHVLVGTLITILRWKLTRNPDKRRRILREHNPFDSSISMYCIAFVADCIEKANVDYIDVQHSVSTVDHGWFTKLKHVNKKINI